MTRLLAGVLPILQTPFTEHDELDLPALRREIDWLFAAGAEGCGTGMVSETARLTGGERRALIEHALEFVAGRGPFFASVGGESAAQAARRARHAADAGCDAVMATPPMLAAAAEPMLRDYYTALAEAVDVPVIVQDASGYAGQGVPLATQVALLERFGPDKILFKPEAPPQGPTLSALRDATGGRARLFEGSGGVYLIDSIRRGVAGTMPGCDLVDGVAAIWRAMRRGDEATAYRVYFPLAALVSLQTQAGLDGFLAIEKYLLARRGVFAAPRRRRPYRWELDDETAAEVDRLWRQMQSALAADTLAADAPGDAAHAP